MLLFWLDRLFHLPFYASLPGACEACWLEQYFLLFPHLSRFMKRIFLWKRVAQSVLSVFNLQILPPATSIFHPFLHYRLLIFLTGTHWSSLGCNLLSRASFLPQLPFRQKCPGCSQHLLAEAFYCSILRGAISCWQEMSNVRFFGKLLHHCWREMRSAIRRQPFYTSECDYPTT